MGVVIASESSSEAISKLLLLINLWIASSHLGGIRNDNNRDMQHSLEFTVIAENFGQHLCQEN